MFVLYSYFGNAERASASIREPRSAPARFSISDIYPSSRHILESIYAERTNDDDDDDDDDNNTKCVFVGGSVLAREIENLKRPAAG